MAERFRDFMGVNLPREEILKRVESDGYKLVDGPIRFEGKTHLVIEDSNSFKYLVELNNLNRGNVLAIARVGSPFSLENIGKWLKINGKSFILCKGNVYERSSKKLKFFCNICNDVFFATWNHISGGQECAVCSGKQVGEHHSFGHLRKDLLKEWSEENDVSPYSVAQFANRTVKWKCDICGNEWKTSILNRSYGTGCPNCKITKGCIIAKEVFEKYGVIFNAEEQFEDLISPRGGNLRYDFAIFDEEGNLQSLIELDGKQHHEFILFFHKVKEEFEYQQLRDQLKNEYAADNNIPLLRISYKDFDNIETILSDWLTKI